MRIRATLEWSLDVPDDVADVHAHVQNIVQNRYAESLGDVVFDEMRLVDVEEVPPWEGGIQL